MEHLANPTEGKIGLVSKELFLADIAKHEGHTIAITIKRKRNGRTVLQNAYYHVVVECIREAMQEAGNDYDHEQVHMILRKEFLSKHIMVVGKSGEYFETDIVHSTTELDTNEFAEYIRKISVWAYDFFSIIIPEPTP